MGLEDIGEAPYAIDRLLTQMILSGAFEGTRPRRVYSPTTRRGHRSPSCSIASMALGASLRRRSSWVTRTRDSRNSAARSQGRATVPEFSADCNSLASTMGFRYLTSHLGCLGKGDGSLKLMVKVPNTDRIGDANGVRT